MATRRYKGALVAPKNERLEARISPQQKSIIQRAAQLSGLSVTDFVVTSAQNKAEEVIREHNIITLTAQDSVLFATALLNPREPDAALRDAFARHGEEVIERD